VFALYTLSFNTCMFSSSQNVFCLTNSSRLVLEIFRFSENQAQNLNSPQNISASWDLQMGFNSAFKTIFFLFVPFPVVTWSKLRFLYRSTAGYAGTIPAGGMYVCLLWLLCVVSWKPLLRVILSSRRVLPSVVRLSMIYYPQHEGSQGPLGVVDP